MFDVPVVASSAATLERSTPTYDDACRAAEALIDLGVNEVWLYGSVARGTQNADSDIDFVAVFDDLDYQRRDYVAGDLAAAASAACGMPCDVHATDHPEWVRRTTNVTCSFEAQIRRSEARRLESSAHRQQPDWDKEIGLPDSNLEDTRGSIGSALHALREVHLHMQPSGTEQGYLRHPKLVRRAEQWRQQRARKVCDQGALVAENVVKALRKLRPTDLESAGPSHDMRALLETMNDVALRQEIYDLFAKHGIDPRSIRILRQVGSFSDAKLKTDDQPWYEPGFVDQQADRFAKFSCEIIDFGNQHLAATFGGRDEFLWEEHIEESQELIAMILERANAALFAGGAYSQSSVSSKENASAVHPDAAMLKIVEGAVTASPARSSPDSRADQIALVRSLWTSQPNMSRKQIAERVDVTEGFVRYHTRGLRKRR